MYRFRPRFERSRLTSGKEPNSGTTAHAGRTTDGLRAVPQASIGARSTSLTGRTVLSREHPAHGVSPRSSSAPLARTPRSAEVTVQGFRLLGMSAREARMYLAFLRGSLGAREAAEIAGLHRATGYRVLLRLLDRGLVVSNGRTPRRFHSVEPSVLFRRLELFYRDETEIPSSLAEAFGSWTETRLSSLSISPLQTEPPRILAVEGKSLHPVLSELLLAKRSVAAVVRPLATPVTYRNALARALGNLARNGVNIRLITDATPADYRFCRAITREAGASAAPVQVRHFCPVSSQLLSIDRQTVIRIPTLGTSNRAPPVGVAITDRARVQALVNRFESLWTEAAGASRVLGSGTDPPHPVLRGEDTGVRSF
jgi:Sugar-specific transcriptional regulator TrmB